MKSNFATLLAGHDAGHYDLPLEVIKARVALERLEKAATARQEPDMAQARHEFVDAMLTAAGNGSAWPDPAALEAAESELRAYSQWASVVREATGRGESELNESIATNIDTIIVSYLRPAHDSAIRIAKANAKMAPLTSPAVMASLEGPQRKKADQLASAAATYSAVRAGWEVLTRSGRQNRHDFANVFGQLHDFTERWPTYRQRGQDFPWPTSPVAYLVWVAANAQPWVPTPDEQEQRYLEVYGEAIEQAKINNHNMQAYAALGGGR